MVRKATSSDLDDIFELVQVFATSFKPEKTPFIHSFTQILQDKQAILLIAEQNNKTVGYCLGFIHATFYANGTVAWLEEIMVQKPFRRTGIGSELLRTFEQEAKSKACKLAALATRRAADFYCANGYEESAVYFRKLL